MAYECIKCGEAIYLGSRLNEDAYTEVGADAQGFKTYKHVTCDPPKPMNYTKGRADGSCGHCGKPVPASNLNKFYCSGSCGSHAYDFHHPEKEEQPNYYYGDEE